MAKEYIERDAALEEQKTFTEYDEGGWDAAVRAVPVDAIKNIPAADVVEVDRLVEVCFHEFCMVAIDSPCGCDGCPYGEFGSENNACYEEYKRRMLSEI